ncbi:hypothetical protein E4U53_006986, partial [Claviceps sorghi]
MSTQPPSPPPDQQNPLSICLPFILTHLQRKKHHPLIIGLNGVQGVGKTTLVASLADALARNENNANPDGKHGIRTLVFSLDDFYLSHEEQLALAEANPGNALVQHRGEP